MIDEFFRRFQFPLLGLWLTLLYAVYSLHTLSIPSFGLVGRGDEDTRTGYRLSIPSFGLDWWKGFQERAM